MEKKYFLNKLTIFKPKNFEIYDYNLVPDNFHHNDKLPIICKKHGVFYQKSIYHIYNSGCVKCSLISQGLNRRKTTEDFIKKSIKKFGNKYNFSKTIYTKKGSNLTLICPDHGEFIIRPEAHLWSIKGCPKCDYELPRKDKSCKFIFDSKNKYKNKYDYSKVKYINCSTKVKIICPIHGLFFQTPFSHVNGKVGCPKCSRELYKISITNFILRVKKLHNDKYDYSKVNFTKLNDKIIITCKKHGEFYQRASSHLEGVGCFKCGAESRLSSKEKFIELSKKVHGDKYDYSKVIYRGNKKKVEIICPIHGSFYKKPNNHTSSKSGCPLCCESKGELLVQSILKKYNINFIREYMIPLNRYRYDFYLPDYNIFIEYNGKQHYAPVKMFGGDEAFEITKERDKSKKILVNINKGYLITISYQNSDEESVEKILINGLKKRFKYWFLINNKIYVFNYFRDVIKKFNLPEQTSPLKLITTMRNKIKNFKLLF